MRPATPLSLINYKTDTGIEPFKEWLDSLSELDEALVLKRLNTIARGSEGNFRNLSGQLFEYKFRNGIRIYAGRDAKTKRILLLGGTKRHQQKDIEAAKRFWTDYQRRIKEE